jgi:hypothetical protein
MHLRRTCECVCMCVFERCMLSFGEGRRRTLSSHCAPALCLRSALFRVPPNFLVHLP